MKNGLNKQRVYLAFGRRLNLARNSERARSARCLALLALLFVPSCNNPHPEPTAGSNSNWLHDCETPSECSAVSACTCGACTVPCTSDADCTRLNGARCALAASPASWAACQSSQPNVSGICLPTCQAGGCEEGQACVSSFCSLLSIPTSTFCGNVVSWPRADRTGEDELLDLLQQARTTGSATCGTGSIVAALRLDGRLTCAARVLASDLSTSGSTSLTDSLGRTSQVRIGLAGYSVSAWGEAFMRAQTAADSFSRMLADTTVCTQLVSSKYVDVGIGVAGNVYVVTLAAP